MSTSDAADLEQLCVLAEEHGASDVLLHEGRPACLRISGTLQPVEMSVLNAEFFDALWRICRVPANSSDHDTSFASQGGIRFRINLLHQLGNRAAVMRRIRTDIPVMEALGLPSALLSHWTERKSGIIFVCGPTGSGKSTTLAAMLESLNCREARHVVTIEDPVEYIFQNKKSIFTQREVGIDTKTFAEGLRRSLRQNPDVIMLGEVRDAPSATTAIQAAETGHLVITTLHATTATETMERLDLIFPADERETARRTLSEQIIGVICQRLLTGVDGKLVLVCEYFTNEGATKKMIAENRLGDLSDLMNRSDSKTARTFLKGLADLVKEEKISEETAFSVAESPQELSRTLRGISSNTVSLRR